MVTKIKQICKIIFVEIKKKREKEKESEREREREKEAEKRATVSQGQWINIPF